MRKFIVVSTLALGVIVAACDRAADTPTAPPRAASTSGGPAVASAHGGGKTTAAGGDTYHFAFSAAVGEDGDTKGNVMLRVGDTRYDADVVCLGVRDDTAVIVAVVSSSTDAGAVGDSLLLTAIDGSDRISEPEFPAAGTAGLRCGTVTASAATLAVEQGNINVRGTSPVLGGTIVAGVVGMGTYTVSASPRIFDTNILRSADGTVSGQYHQEDQGGGFRVLEASCLTVSGDSALIGGTIIASSNATLVGREGGAIVVDHAPSSPDQATGLFHSTNPGPTGITQGFCNGAFALTLNNLTSGDVAVFP
jgi:hypothetical protein